MEAGVSGLLKADVRSGSLQVDRVRNLVLTGHRSDVVVSRVERLSRLEMSDGTLSLDLAAIRHNPTLQLAGHCRAEVGISQPCVVVPEGPPALIDYSVDVSGCELRVPGQPLRPSRSRLILRQPPSDRADGEDGRGRDVGGHGTAVQR